MLEEGSKDAGGHGERKAGGEVGGKTGIPEPVRSRGSQVQGRWSEGWTSTVGLTARVQESGRANFTWGRGREDVHGRWGSGTAVGSLRGHWP